MKKTLITIGLASLMIFASGCQAKDTFAMYQQGIASITNAKSYEIKNSSEIEISQGTKKMSNPVITDIKRVIKADGTSDVAMVTDISYNGTKIKPEAYYTNGLFYTNTDGAKGKKAMTQQTFDTTYGDLGLLKFEKNDIVSSKTKSVNKNTDITYVIKKDSMKALFDKEKQNIVSSAGVTDADVTTDFTDIKYDLVVDDKGKFVSSEETFTINFAVKGVKYTGNYKVDLQAVQLENVKIDFPSDLESYGTGDAAIGADAATTPATGK